MACTITVTSVIGIPAGPGFSPPGAVSAIVVTGTATNLASVIVNLFAAVQFPVTNGQWQATIAVPLLTKTTYAAACGETITFFVTDPTGTECGTEWSQPLACPTCPTIVIDPPTIGDCAADGTRPVTLTVQINQPVGQSSAFQWDFGGGVFGPVFFVPPPPNPTLHSYVPGNPTATLKTVIPQGCPDVPVQLSVPSCACPQIQDITFSDGDCDSQGNRQVTATVTGSLGGTIFWQWSGQAQSHQGGTSDTATFPGGTTQTVTVVIIQTGCTPVTLPKSHAVASCPIPPPCPTVTNLTATPAAGTAPLAVSFQATVTNAASIVPDTNGNLFHWSFGDNATQDTQASSTSHTYTTSPTASACVTVNGPQGCNPSTACTPVTVGTGTGNGNQIACGIMRLALALLFALFFVTLAGWACLSWPISVPVILGIAILVLLIVWIVFCHPSLCEVLLTIWQTLFVSTMGLLYVGPCLGQVASTLCTLLSYAWIAAGVLCLAIFLWWALRRSCDAGRCQILNAWLGAVLDATADLGLIYLVLKYVQSTFPNCTVNGSVTAILGVVALILTAILAGGHCTIDPIRLGPTSKGNQETLQRPCC